MPKSRGCLKGISSALEEGARPRGFAAPEAERFDGPKRFCVCVCVRARDGSVLMCRMYCVSQDLAARLKWNLTKGKRLTMFVGSYSTLSFKHVIY